MPHLIALLLGGLVSSAGTIVGKVLLSLGFGYVTYTGLSIGLAWVRDQVVLGFAGMPPEPLQVLSALKVGSGLNVLLSALSVKLLLNGLTSDTLKKMVLK